MKKIIQLEELAQFVVGFILFLQTDYTWWWFPLLLLVPDMSMLGYVFGNKIGAYSYNIAHHKGVAILVYLAGIYTVNPVLQLAGIILFSHSSMDRIFGYGLKYTTGFSNTHLGIIGKNKTQ
ncbi:DUF4260 domain-containing protein [Flavobacterium cerinum]|uniref:DUF4260 domain-containing protein n=1 Tax=Flavobacterium cerinum TaxID=2502784 RepID=A0ABY5ITA3_9FLAO|nr:DUF4260 domain-containing protein [Flavobacterium cerinum]UUC45884.1 DUF4260 domain-containing protein [Flavobacterium cerinum]